MNLKLLEKLVRLATNNTNENEANLAARRVCKLILDGKFKFVEDISTGNDYPWNHPIKNDPNFSDPLEWFRGVYYKARETQPDWEGFNRTTSSKKEEKELKNCPICNYPVDNGVYTIRIEDKRYHLACYYSKKGI